MFGRRLLLTVFVVSTNLAVPAAAQPPVASASIKYWLGNWEFTECWQGVNKIEHPCIIYELHISQAGDQTIADLDLDGFQTMSRIRGAVERTTNGVRITFAGIREPGSFDNTYNAGDVLFELSRKNGRVLTTWKNMTPELDKNKRTGVHFVKVK